MILLVLILLSNFVAPRANSIDTSSEIENTIENREIQDVQTQPATTTTQKDSSQ